MNSTEAGIMADFKLLHPLNVAFLMICSPSGSFSVSIPLQFSNALSPMFVTLLGMVTEARPLQ
jgi:hypothetical protein